MEPSTGGAHSHGAYALLECLYRHASVRAPKTSWTDMEKVRGDFQTLYQREETHPLVPPLATQVEMVKVNDEIPSEAEVEAVVCHL